MESVSTSGSGILFLGTGSSTGVPTPRCVLQPSDPPCPVCSTSLVLQPHENPNYRCNPSIVIRYASHPDGRTRHIQIDCGKHFRESMLRWFPRYSIPSLDALVLTHEHADATLGIDDIRGLQGMGEAQETLSLFLSAHSLESVGSRFPYLLPKAQEGAMVKRRVAAINWRKIERLVPFSAEGLEITPIPLHHGDDYEALGFLFGSSPGGVVAYLSDCSRVPEESMELLRGVGGGAGGIELLVLDSLLLEKKHPTHLCMMEALDVIRVLRPKRSMLTGLSHEFDHEVTGARLAALKDEEGLDVSLPRDGLWVPMGL